MAKIDYDVGDLIVAVRDSKERPDLVRRGFVYTAAALVPCRSGTRLAVQLDGVNTAGRLGFCVTLFRKLPKKSQEFFAGETQTVRGLVPAT